MIADQKRWRRRGSRQWDAVETFPVNRSPGNKPPGRSCTTMQKGASVAQMNAERELVSSSRILLVAHQLLSPSVLI